MIQEFDSHDEVEEEHDEQGPAGFASWDDVPDIHPDGRSVLPYPGTAPDGSEWREYFQLLQDRGVILHGGKAEPEPEREEDDGSSVYKGWGPVVVTQEAEEFDDPCGPLASFVKLASANGWQLEELSHALSFAEGLEFSSGAKAGVKRPDREIDLQWAKFSHETHGRCLVAYPIVNGKVNGTQVVRSFNGIRLSDADMRARMKGEIND